MLLSPFYRWRNKYKEVKFFPKVASNRQELEFVPQQIDTNEKSRLLMVVVILGG